MSIIGDLRAELAQDCAAATGWVAHSEPPKSMSAPCIIIMHGSPLMVPDEEITFSEALEQGVYQINLIVTALVSDNDNAIANLETVIDDLLPVLLPTQVSELLVFTYATNNYLGVQFSVTQSVSYGD